MAEDFDRFLAEALSPPGREVDRSFVVRVQAQIAMEERFAAQRRLLMLNLAQQLVALMAVGAGAWWLGKAAPIAAWAGDSPAAALATFMAMFMFLAAVVTLRTGSGQPRDISL